MTIDDTDDLLTQSVLVSVTCDVTDDLLTRCVPVSVTSDGTGESLAVVFVSGSVFVSGD